MISKRCEQKPACQSLQQSAPTCGEGSVCFSCCDLNYCNLFERPHQRNFSKNTSLLEYFIRCRCNDHIGLGASCLTAFPGYPQCKRSSFSDCMNLALNERCARDRCNCDKDCKLFDDCCDDYDAVCSSMFINII